jgi:hypothetical protein
MSSVRLGAAVVQRYIVSLYFLGVIVQFFLVGLGLFGMKSGSTIDNAKSLDAHRTFGFLLVDVGGALLLISSLIAWQRPRRQKVGLYVLLAVLGQVQGVLATEGWHHQYVGMFHPVNALLLLGLSGMLAHQAWADARAHAHAPEGATEALGTD